MRGGTLELLDADGRTGETAGGPIDAALSVNDRCLYTLNASGSLSVFRVREHGALVPLETIVGLPAGANGLAAR
jgi:hypothetical protein